MAGLLAVFKRSVSSEEKGVGLGAAGEASGGGACGPRQNPGPAAGGCTRRLGLRVRLYCWPAGLAAADPPSLHSRALIRSCGGCCFRSGQSQTHSHCRCHRLPLPLAAFPCARVCCGPSCFAVHKKRRMDSQTFAVAVAGAGVVGLCVLKGPCTPTAGATATDEGKSAQSLELHDDQLAWLTAQCEQYGKGKMSSDLPMELRRREEQLK